MKVELSRLSYSASYPSGRATLHLKGRCERAGIRCEFELTAGRRGHTLRFKEAKIFDGSDPREVALAVKNELLAFVSSDSGVPDNLREALRLCILNHPKDNNGIPNLQGH